MPNIATYSYAYLRISQFSFMRQENRREKKFFCLKQQKQQQQQRNFYDINPIKINFLTIHFGNCWLLISNLDALTCKLFVIIFFDITYFFLQIYREIEKHGTQRFGFFF